MSGFIRQINSSDGAPITPPTTVKESVAKMVVFANDAAYEAIYGAGSQGDIYYNSTELLVREHNGTEWVYGQNGINALEDSTSTGSSQDLDPTYHNLIQVSNGSLTSVRSINDAQTSICYLVNATGNDILLLNEDGGAPSGEELMLPGAVNFTLEDGNVAHFVKDSITNAWRYTNAAGSGGGDGSGTGAKNYVLSPDSSTNVTDVGGSSSTDTTTLADLPEETKGVGVLVTQTAGSIGDTSTWETNAIDDGDGGRNGSAEMYWKTKAGYVADSASIQWYNSDTAEILRSYDIPADSSGRISDYADSTVIMTAGENVKPRIYWNVTDETNGLVVSGAGTLAETRLVGEYSTTTKEVVGGDVTTDTDFITFSDLVIGDTYQVSWLMTMSANSTDQTLRFNVNHDGVSRGTVLYDNEASATDQYTLGGSTDRFVATSTTITLATSSASSNAKILADSATGSSYSVLKHISPVMYGTEAQGQNARGRFYRLGAHSYTAGTDFPFDTEDTVTYDPAFGISNASGVFTVDASGTYDIGTMIGANPAWGSNTILQLFVNRSGGGLTLERELSRPATGGFQTEGSTSVKLSAGDSFSIRLSNNNSGGIVGSNTTWIEIERRSDKSSKGTGFPFPNGTVRLDTGNGHGSTNTMIRRFTNITEQSGDAFTYADSATDGMSITVNREMVASITYSDRYNSSTGQHGISKNASGTTAIFSVPAANKLAICYVSAGNYGNVAATVRLSKGDVIRAHDAGNNDNISDNVQFIIQEVYRIG